jgi:hypothetical protein
MSRTDPHENLTGADVEHLRRLEAIAQRNLDTYMDVGNALASIRDKRLYRDTHDSFEAYARDRWGMGDPGGLGVSLSRALRAIAGDELGGADIHITIRKHGEVAERGSDPTLPPPIARLVEDEGPAELRWLLAQASGMIASVTHRLEARSALLGDAARGHIRDDVLELEEELVRLQAVLVAPLDWDAEYERLLRGEIPPLDDEEEVGE